MTKYLLLLCPAIAWAVTFEEFRATYPDADIHRAAAAYEASLVPPPAPPVPPTPEQVEAARIAAEIADHEARTEAAWPLLTDHPATNEVPAGGMCYRLQEGGVVTWWVLRQGDLIATQISAHNAAGEEILRTVNLTTRKETEVNIARIVNAKNFSDIKAARTNRMRNVRGVAP